MTLGERVAARVLRWRDHDGLDATVPYVQRPPGPGVWEPTAPTPPVDLVLTQVRPLAMRSADQFRPAGPYALTGPKYRRDVDEVRRLGRADSTERTAGQTAIARFWADQTAAADPTWQSLLNVNHPEYPSGHACLTGAVVTALRSYFGTDRVPLTVDSTTTGDEVRYPTFSASLAEVTEARIWSGLHFRHSMEDGATVGRRAASWALSHRFKR